MVEYWRYLACLQVENGQLSLNADAMAQLAQSKLDDAQATAVTQAMTELDTIAKGENSSATLYTTPDYTKMLSSLKTNNTPVMVTQSVNITLPNVTNNSGYENLTRELNRLKLDAYQFANRRN